VTAALDLVGERVLDLSRRIDEFFDLVAQERVEIYNEFSLQHELGVHLRSVLPRRFKVQFERPVGFFDIKAQGLPKKEIDISVFAEGQGERVAIELKFPRNGQYPEQMFSACRDMAFLEELVRHGFNAGFFVIAADDPLFYRGPGQDGIYACFRAGRPIHGNIRKPTGARDESLCLAGSYALSWKGTDTLRYALVAITRGHGV
jgi:hypothetical protein